MRKFIYYSVCLLGIVVGCDCSGQRNKQQENRTGEQIREERVQATRDFLAKERESINAYIKERKLDMKRSGTGLYYQFITDKPGALIKPEDDVIFTYSIQMLSGEVLYTSDENGPKTLRVDREDEVIGLHEALKLLSKGDKGRFILPSHLAYGVAGDQIEVPPMTALVYEIEILEIK